MDVTMFILLTVTAISIILMMRNIEKLNTALFENKKLREELALVKKNYKAYQSKYNNAYSEASANLEEVLEEELAKRTESVSGNTDPRVLKVIASVRDTLVQYDKTGKARAWETLERLRADLADL